jgi:hypothetical protein
MNEENRFSNPPKNPDVNQRKPSGRVGLRGCWELLIKVIILLILIAILIAYWLGALGPFGPRGEYNSYALATLIALILLLLYLIWRQKHFVCLQCGLTDPTGCQHGDITILAGRVLIPIKGTASGLGFSRYTLELSFGSTVITGGIVYADSAGNPDLAATFGNHQVTSGILGFVDAQQAVIGAGAGFLTSTSFTTTLRVFGIDGSSQTCGPLGFELAAARSFIKKVGAAWAHDYVNPNEPLCRIAPPTGHVINQASVGGWIYIRGVADSYGCAAERISEVHVWAIPDATFSFAQPANGTPIVPPVGGVPWANVSYTTDAERNANRLDATSDEGSILTFADGWGVRVECAYLPFPPWISCWTLPDLVEQYWVTPATGKYTLLLAVKDTAGNTYYDIQHVWVDNDPVVAHITSIGGLNGCLDLRLSKFVGTTCEIRGVAWDRAIRAIDPQVSPNDNFAGYNMSFQKNGGGGGPITAATPALRVPNVWAEVQPAGDGVLANWDIIAALDFGAAGPVPAGSGQIARGEHCAYIIALNDSDTTLVGEGGSSHPGYHPYAINVINDL